MKLISKIGKKFALVFDVEEHIIACKAAETNEAGDLQDGIYEELTKDFDVLHTKVTDGVVREVTEGQAVRYALDAAGRDPRTKKRRYSKPHLGRRNTRLSDLVEAAAEKILASSTNGTFIYVDLSKPHGAEIVTSDSQVAVGNYRGAHKGYSVFGKEHEIKGSVDDVAYAFASIGYNLIDNMIPMRILWSGMVDGDNLNDPCPVWKTSLIRRHRGGSEVVEGFVIGYRKPVFGRTLRGAKAKLAIAFAGRKAAVAEEAERLEREAARLRVEEDMRVQKMLDDTIRLEKQDEDAFAGMVI